MEESIYPIINNILGRIQGMEGKPPAEENFNEIEYRINYLKESLQV